jgi:hypothetical protein
MSAEMSPQVAEMMKQCRAQVNSPYMLSRAENLLRTCEIDCRSLDSNDMGGGSYFLSRFHNALTWKDAAGAILNYLRIAGDGRKDRSLEKAYAASEAEGDTAYYMQHIRELVRDGWPLEKAIQSVPESFILQRHEAGDVKFFVQMGATITHIQRHPNRYQRNYESWIIRAWMAHLAACGNCERDA